jgi:hypothetical protein
MARDFVPAPRLASGKARISRRDRDLRVTHRGSEQRLLGHVANYRGSLRIDPDSRPTRSEEAAHRKEAQMATFWTIVALGFVLAVLALVAWSLIKTSPLGHHVDHYRDPKTGKRRWESPNLEDGHY